MTKTTWFLCFCAFVFLYSCETERDPCLQPTSVPLRIHALRPSNDTSSIDTLLPDPWWKPLDSPVALTFGSNVSNFNLLLSPISDSCKYTLQPDTAVAAFDTLTFYYNRRLQFISNACGYTYFFTLLQVRSTTHNIDSVKLNNGDVNSNVNTPEHVKIYF